jgi:hypothetical protein
MQQTSLQLGRDQQGDFTSRLREISKFFDGTDRVHRTMRRIANEFEKAGIRYALVGGMAVNAHRHERTTKDVDFLLSADGFMAFQQRVDAIDVERVPGHPRRFVDRTTGVRFDILVTGLFPASGAPGPIAFPEPQQSSIIIDNLHVVDLKNLIQLKLAARRHQDFADVVNLIRVNNLTETFADELHPSVRADYIECLEEMRREDEYEARQDQAWEERRKKETGE